MDAVSIPDSLIALRPTDSQTRRVVQISLIVLTVLWIVLLIPALMFALLSPFAFDSGATEEAYRVFYTLISFPFVLSLSPMLAWMLYHFKRYILAALVVLAPALYLVYAVFLMN
jgi:asparagine N-glycosylation enzyme membrane subunit Stt3